MSSLPEAGLGGRGGGVLELSGVLAGLDLFALLALGGATGCSVASVASCTEGGLVLLFLGTSWS